MADFFSYSAPAGTGTDSVSTERQIMWGPNPWFVLKQARIVNTATDVGNTPTTELRAGLLMGQLDATPFTFTNYAPNAVDGTEKVSGFLWESRKMTDSDGVAQDRDGQVCVAGPVKAGQLILLDQQARAQMYNRFIFDDDLTGNSAGWKRVVAKTADYTVLVADNNTIFTNLGTLALVTFTLPTIAKGLRYRFYSEDNDGIRVASAITDTLVVHNDVAADSIAFSTTGRNIGAAFEVFANSDASKWLVFPFVWNIADDGSTTSKATIVT